MVMVKILSTVAKEAAEQKGTAKASAMEWCLSLGSSPL
jgi:hypothetical protein